MDNLNEQTSILFDFDRKSITKTYVFKDIIIDRKSKYTVVWTNVSSKEDILAFLKELLRDNYYRKATHNTYAYRILQKNWSILEWKNDDWETWAWMCILRELQRAWYVNILLIVTRYFWWIKLQADRFKNVINCCKMFFEKIEKSS